MKNVRFAVLAGMFISGGAVSLFGSPQTVEGVISDTMCCKKHMLPGKPDAECIKECVGGNTKFALLVGHKVYALSGPAGEFQKYAGKKVRVTGDVTRDAISVSTIGVSSR